MSKQTLYPVLILLLLFSMSILGNLFHLELFLGVDFIFSSIFVFIILHYFGPKQAIFTAFAASIYTIILWGSIYGFITLLAEAIFVSYFYFKRKQNMILWDAVFLFFIGMPLSYVFSSFFLNLDLMNTLLIMLKQGVNMLFNVLIANILIILIEAILQSKTKRKVSLQEILFNLMMLFFLFPLLGSLIYIGQGDLNNVTKRHPKTDR
ncbi:hypothetical protein [Metabacillus idriensis]|uniref:hypothetical protein n=1 Tax=Metabacillus idriensis TaxID=324768 RepID=UPI00174D84E6|nr:hypothetical protein [Metabacillus idriensis]